MSCPICSGFMRASFTAQVLHKYSAQYEVCDGCGYLCVHEPHWLEEAYSSAIAAADTGLVMRNISLAYKVASVLYCVMGERGHGRYLDAAGGYGMLTRLMRDLGFDFYWTDKYCSNLLARGFEYDANLGACRAITAMEVLEHLTDPVAFVEDILQRSGANTLLCTTELYEGAPPTPEAWWYYAFPTGQHIGFFQRRSLEELGRRLGLTLFSMNGIHILTRERLNELPLKWASHSYVSRLASPWIRRRMGSKTMADHRAMMAAHQMIEQ
jgi:hypothetical protein